MPSGAQLTHRPQGQMSVSGLRTRVPGTVRVAAETQTETAAQSRVFSPCRVRRARARESPCQTPVVGRQRVTSGSGVMLSLGDGDRQREVSRRATQHDVTEKSKARHMHHKRACLCGWRARQTPLRLRTCKRNRTSHPHGFTNSLTHTHHPFRLLPRRELFLSTQMANNRGLRGRSRAIPCWSLGRPTLSISTHFGAGVRKKMAPAICTPYVLGHQIWRQLRILERVRQGDRRPSVRPFGEQSSQESDTEAGRPERKPPGQQEIQPIRRQSNTPTIQQIEAPA